MCMGTPARTSPRATSFSRTTPPTPRLRWFTSQAPSAWCWTRRRGARTRTRRRAARRACPRSASSSVTPTTSSASRSTPTGALSQRGSRSRRARATSRTCACGTWTRATSCSGWTMTSRTARSSQSPSAATRTLWTMPRRAARCSSPSRPTISTPCACGGGCSTKTNSARRSTSRGGASGRRRNWKVSRPKRTITTTPKSTTWIAPRAACQPCRSAALSTATSSSRGRTGRLLRRWRRRHT
mmetsp:Transcript_15838/g.46815  ORF Transcript_15838/g.46815 Transcript_15838/m.46815 type:complete len:241 (+) Transcript_15838:1777-2499(+)